MSPVTQEQRELYDLQKSWRISGVFQFDLLVPECLVARQVKVFHGQTYDFQFFLSLT